MDGFPSCFPGCGGGPTSVGSVFPGDIPVPIGGCESPSLNEDVVVPEVVIGVLAGLVAVAVVLLEDELVTTLIGGCVWGPSPATCGNRATEGLGYTFFTLV